MVEYKIIKKVIGFHQVAFPGIPFSVEYFSHLLLLKNLAERYEICFVVKQINKEINV